jgi:ribosome-associated translation inhibitor RaiA
MVQDRLSNGGLAMDPGIFQRFVPFMSSANQLLDRSEMLAMVGARQGAQLQAVTSVRLNLERDRGQIAAVRVEHAKVVARMNQHRRDMQAKFSAAARVLNSLEGKAKARYEAQQRVQRAAQLAEGSQTYQRIY